MGELRRAGRRRARMKSCAIACGVVITLFVIAGFLYAIVARDGDDGFHGGTGGHVPDQVDFQTDVLDNRGQLFAGSLAYDSSISTQVDEPVTCWIRLTALSDEAAGALETARPAAEAREFPVGGVEGATLVPVSQDVQVELLFDSQTKQVIAEPGDHVAWQWSVTAREPGDYQLNLVITTYQRDSDLALETLDPPVTIHLSVSNTWAHRLDAVRGTLIALGGVAVALTALLVFRAPLATFARTRRETWREKHRSHDGYM